MSNSTLSVSSTLLNGKYRIEAILGQGGFGITYLAVHTILGKKVAIKEFFPKEYCDREGNTSHITIGTQSNSEFVTKLRNKFIKEAQNIAKLSHANIIQIQDIFEENNTAYYVMEYIEGASLEEIVTKQGALAPARAVKYIEAIAGALRHMHNSKMMHLDVKPANIMIRTKDDCPILIDFGLSKGYTAQGGQTTTTPHGISQGYSPFEQYDSDGVSKFSPQTDIYSLAATLYKLITGTTPPEATKRAENSGLTFPDTVSDSLRNMIETCMAFKKSDRPADMDKVLDIMATVSTDAPSKKSEKPADKDKIVTVTPDDQEDTVSNKDKSKTFINNNKPGKQDKKHKKNSGLWIILTILLAVAAGVTCYFIFAGGAGKGEDDPIIPDTEKAITPAPTVDSTQAETDKPAATEETTTKADPEQTPKPTPGPTTQDKKTDAKPSKEKKRDDMPQPVPTPNSGIDKVRKAAAAVGRGNMDAGMWVTGASVSGKTLVFSVSCDRNVYEAEDFNNTSHFSSAMRAYMGTHSAAAQAASLAKQNGMSVRFNFSGASSKSLSY